MRLHIDKFSDKLSQNGHIFGFSAVTFFVLKIEKTFFFSTDRNMVFPQILSYIPLLYDQWLPRYANNPHANCRNYIWGGCRLKTGGNIPKTNFKQVLDHLLRFEIYTFLISKRTFFHSILTKTIHNLLIWVTVFIVWNYGTLIFIIDWFWRQY